MSNIAYEHEDPTERELRPVRVDSTSVVRRNPKASSSNARDKALIRRVATKAQKLAETAPEHLDTLAIILGSGATLADLTVATITASRQELQPASDLQEIFDADPMEAGVIAAAKGRNRLKAVWTLTAHLGLTSNAIPESDAKAAIALARALHEHENASSAHNAFTQALQLVGK